MPMRVLLRSITAATTCTHKPHLFSMHLCSQSISPLAFKSTLYLTVAWRIDDTSQTIPFQFQTLTPFSIANFCAACTPGVWVHKGNMKHIAGEGGGRGLVCGCTGLTSVLECTNGVMPQNTGSR